MIFFVLPGKAAVADAVGEWKEDRNARPKRMRLPVSFGIVRTGNYVERSYLVAATLKSSLGNDDGAFGLSFDSYKIHD